jgi:hypothetical protein
LFGDDDERRRRVEQALLELDKESRATITRASLLDRTGRPHPNAD